MDIETRDLRTTLEKWARNVEPRLLDGAGAARQLRQVAVEDDRGVGEDASCSPGGGDRRRAARRPQDPAHFVARQTGTSIHQAVVTCRPVSSSRSSQAVADTFATGRVQPRPRWPRSPPPPRLAGAPRASARGGRRAQPPRPAPRRVPAGQGRRHRHAGPAYAVPRAGVAHLDRLRRRLASPRQRHPTDGARIMARLNAETDKVFREARASRKPERVARRLPLRRAGPHRRADR